MQTRQQKRKQDTSKPTTRSKNSKLVKTTSSGRRVIPTLHALNAAEDAEDYDEGNLEMVDDDEEEEIYEDEEEYTPDSEKQKNTDKHRTTSRFQEDTEAIPTPPPDEMDESNPLEEEDNEGASALISLFSSGALFSPPKEETKTKKKKPPAKKKKKVKTEKRPRPTTKKIRTTKPKTEYKKRTSSYEDYQEGSRRNGMRRPSTPFTRESLDKLFLSRKFVEQPPMSLRIFDQAFLSATNSKRAVDKDFIFTSVPPPIDPTQEAQEVIQSKTVQSERTHIHYNRCAYHVKIAFFIYDKQKGENTDPTLEARLLKERALNKKQPPLSQKNRPLQSNKFPPYQPRGPIGTPPATNLTPGLNSRAPLMMAPSQLRSPYPPAGYPSPGGRGTNIQPLPSQLPLSNIGARTGFPLTMQQGQNIMFNPYPYLVNQNLMNQRRPSTEQMPLQQRMPPQRAPTTSPQQKKMQPNGQTNPQSPVGNKPMTQQDQKNTRIYPQKPVSMNVIGETTPQNLPQ